MKVFFIVFFQISLISTHGFAGALPYRHIAKDSGGKVLYMAKAVAIKYCDDRQSHLPTTRELSLFAKKYGAVGSLETKFTDISIEDSNVKVEMEKLSAGNYRPVFRLNSSGDAVIRFYHNYLGFKAPTQDIEENGFWSSDDNPVAPLDKSYSFNGASGEIWPAHPQADFIATICVAN